MPAVLDIVIVNWNSGRELRDCLESIAAAWRDGVELGRVVVVDNASRDGSADGLEGPGLPLTVVRNPENRGFAAACNQGANGSRAKYLLFLNPDVQLLADSLSVPVAVMERPGNERVGICGIQLLDQEGRVWRRCARFPTPARFLATIVGLDRLWPRRFPSHFMTEWDHATTRDVDQVMGAFFLVRRSLFEALGGFDERFFVYFEDADFSYRARAQAWRSLYLAQARARHWGGGTSRQVKARRLFYSLRSRLSYAYKHFGFAPATALAFATLLIEPVSRLALSAARLSPAQIVETLHGFGLLWRDVPRVLWAGLQRKSR